MNNAQLSDGERTLLYWLWRMGHEKPNSFTTDKHELSSKCKRDVRTIEGNLKRLRAKGRIDYEWNTETGAITIYVYNPVSVEPEGKPNPQKLLPLDNPGSTNDHPETDPRVSAFVQGVYKASAESAQIIPGSNSEPVSSHDVTVSTLERFAQNVPGPLNDIEINEGGKISKSAKLQRVNGSERVAQTDRDTEYEQKTGAAAFVSDALNVAAKNILEATDPTEQKRRLKKQILVAVGTEGPKWWVAGAGADLVIRHGLPIEKMQELLERLVRGRHIPESDRDHIFNPGGWLQGELAKQAPKFNMRWPGRKSTKNDAVSASQDDQEAGEGYEANEDAWDD